MGKSATDLRERPHCLVHPENWKRGRKYNSERRWIPDRLPRDGHYVLWPTPTQGGSFAYRFVRVFSERAAPVPCDGQVATPSRLQRRRPEHVPADPAGAGSDKATIAPATSSAP